MVHRSWPLCRGRLCSAAAPTTQTGRRRRAAGWRWHGRAEGSPGGQVVQWLRCGVAVLVDANVNTPPSPLPWGSSTERHRSDLLLHTGKRGPGSFARPARLLGLIRLLGVGVGARAGAGVGTGEGQTTAEIFFDVTWTATAAHLTAARRRPRQAWDGE